MSEATVQHGTQVVVLVGAGLSKAVGLAAHHDADASFDGTPVPQIASLEGWTSTPERVRRYYDSRRMETASVLPSEAHEALARAQHALTTSRCLLVTENIDEMLKKASAEQVLELHGSLFRLRCTDDVSHPKIGVYGAQNPASRCSTCGATLRPDVVWPGEAPYNAVRVTRAIAACDVFLAVGTSATTATTEALIARARSAGAHTIEINPQPTGLDFDEVFAQPAQDALPSLVSRWLD